MNAYEIAEVIAEYLVDNKDYITEIIKKMIKKPYRLKFMLN